MANSRLWPFDDDDRPSGSVRPLSEADLQVILAHLGDDPDELLAGTGADQPVVAVRVRASVGRPGGSAQVTWRHERAAAWAAWTRTLPWRVAATLGLGAGGGLVASLLAPRLSLVVGGLVATAAGWRLRFRASPDAVAWRRGAAGERCTARLLGPLERQGWVVLHDLAVPGSRANLDHLVIGPGGMFVIDSKQYRGRLQVDPSGRLWHGRNPLAPTLRAVAFEADQAARVLPDRRIAALVSVICLALLVFCLVERAVRKAIAPAIELAELYIGRPAKPTGRLIFEALAWLRLNPARGHDPPTIPTPAPLQAKLQELLKVDPTRPRWAS